MSILLQCELWKSFLFSCFPSLFFHSPTNTFTISEPQDQEISEFYVVQDRRATDSEAPKLWKGSSGHSALATQTTVTGLIALAVASYTDTACPFTMPYVTRNKE